MPIPIVAGIAAALGLGLVEVGKVLAVEAPKEAVKRLVNRKMDQIEKDEALLTAVEEAFRGVGAPSTESELEKYILHLGFDQLQAEDNKPLRQDFARAVLLMTGDDPALIPDSLTRALRWPTTNRQILADFLQALRLQLSGHSVYGPLIACADRKEVRGTLRRMGVDVARTADYVRALLLDRNIDPDKPDADALKEYVTHIEKTCGLISFLFIKPAGRRGQVRTEAELEAVFVPLQVQDPETEERMRRKAARMRLEDMEDEARRAEPVTINEVLSKYPVFLLKGLPGSGKTTLLRHLAVCFARGEADRELDWAGEPLLPIMVPLRNFGRFLADNRREYTSPAPLALRKFIEDYFAEHELQLPQDFFHRRLKEGRCLVLLDGLDEVADRNLRATVAQMVHKFIAHYDKNGNRFGLASRPKGYEEVAVYLLHPVVCDVQPLTPEGRDELVAKLLKVLEPQQRQRRDETRQLLNDIRDKEKVDDLSRNPLFCTTLVLVYKYRGTALPERRVDVYHELVNLLLGFWETHKAEVGVADVRELVLVDGTGRPFMDEGEAVEAKRRALTDVADWMQRKGLAEVPQSEAEAHLAEFFHDREGASEEEKDAWAKNFLAVAHQRSGLFIEAQPEVYAFSHQNFREYLAATALIGQLDDDMVATVLAYADDAWWEEVILLAAAHPDLSVLRREHLLDEMMGAGHITLAGRCAVDAGARLPAPLRREIRDALPAVMTDASLDPKARHAAGEVLDELGWLPDDLNDWVRCQGCAEGGGDLMATRYPVTNSQYERFVLAGGYAEPKWWGGKKGEGWKWRTEEHNVEWRGKEPVAEPEYWQQPRFGKDRRGYPVVGVSWYEAAAYAVWLADVLRRAREGDPNLPEEDKALVEDLLKAGAREIRLPADEEWLCMAGGEARGRFPWDSPEGPATNEEEIVKARANTGESGIGGTTPVAMYPLGKSAPFKVMDLAGNVWEWTMTSEGGVFVVRGGSWNHYLDFARCSFRSGGYPNISNNVSGFRLVSPVGSGF